MTLGRLAGHLAEAPSWEVSILTTEEFDIAPPDGGGYAPPVFESLDDILGAFDRGVSEIEAALKDRDAPVSSRPKSIVFVELHYICIGFSLVCCTFLLLSPR